MTNKLIGVIDYGSGNIFSVAKGLHKIGYNVKVSSDTKELMACDGLILPGVGAFGDAVRQLRSHKLDTLVFDYVETGKTFLGICVGMQLLLDDSNEFGSHRGLGIISGKIRKISFLSHARYKVPVIGWRQITYTENTRINVEFDEHKVDSFYFVHSYSAREVNDMNIAATYSVGGQSIIAMIRKNNVFGVQFHPERSGESGQLFLKKIFQ